MTEDAARLETPFREEGLGVTQSMHTIHIQRGLFAHKRRAFGQAWFFLDDWHHHLLLVLLVLVVLVLVVLLLLLLLASS